MKTINYYLIILVTASSCSMLKRTSTEINKESLTAIQDSKKTESTVIDSVARQDYLSVNKISDQSSYQLKLWPKGKIIYHSMDSFEGEFDSITMSGSLHKKIDNATISSADSRLKKEKLTVAKEYSKFKSAEKSKAKKSVPDYLLIIVVSVLLLAGAMLLIKYFKKRVRL